MVWIALSDLFLDTDVTLFYDNIIRVIAKTDFTDEELAYILMNEVQPAFMVNLVDMAGEWLGFDEAWVIQRVEAVLAGEPRPQGMAWLKTATYAEKHWEAIIAKRDAA